jgi:hypothetical protein
MSSGPYLYDDDPAPLHTGVSRRRPWLLLAIFGGTIVAGVLMVLLLPVVKGSPDEQVREAVGVFVAALAKDDRDTAYTLLCEEERTRLPMADFVDEYGFSGTGSVTSAEEVRVDGVPHYQVQVHWSGGGSAELTVVNEDGPRVCGIAAG